MKHVLLWATILIPSMLWAQKKGLLKYTNLSEVGILMGKTETAWNVRTINGITYKQASVGLGVGYDNYGYKSVPVFIDARKQFGNRKCKFVLYADGGLNFPLRSDYFPEKWNNGNIAYQFNATFYGEAGFGMNQKINKSLSLNITAGYSYKHFSYVEYSQMWYSSPYLYSSGNATYDYYYRRFSVRMGLQLN
jgi:hypothetical protein